MRVGYTEADFARAIDIVGREGSLAVVVEGLGIDWDYLSWLALGVAEEVLGRTTDAMPEALANGAEAFTAGLLIGIYLPERRETPADLGIQVPWAVDEVRERGRHAVIADHCDLETITVLEKIYSSALIEALQLPKRRLTGLEAAFSRLLESGLATGLVLTRDAL